MTTPQVIISAQEDLQTIISDMHAAFVRWAQQAAIDAGEFGEKIADIIDALDDYRQAYAPTASEREAQDRDHADELAREVFQDAQEETA